MVSIEDYKGREQAYVKHVLLEQYLQALVHKTASVYPHIVYVDGFAGPWQSANENHEDTSFGIALRALRTAKAAWKGIGRNVKMTAILIEKSPTAFKELEKLPPKFPDVQIISQKGDFVGLIPTILSKIPKDAFSFFLLDPKGWRIPLNTIEPLLARPNSEVLFNFMFEFINRAASIDDPAVVAGLNELLPSGNWRQRLNQTTTSDQRKEVLIDAFTQCILQAGNFRHVCETTILRPDRDRPLYSLFYGTRHDRGLEVFRDCQVKALEAQAATRAATKVDKAEAKSHQTEMFGSFHEMGENEANTFLEFEKSKARDALIALAPDKANPILYKDLWPLVLAKYVVRLTTVNQLAAQLRKDNVLDFPDWEPRKRVPQPNYRCCRKENGTR